MSGGYDTVTEGAILVLTIVAWNWLLDMLSFRFAAGASLRAAPPPHADPRRRAAAAQHAA